jgi:hypothetical protein
VPVVFVRQLDHGLYLAIAAAIRPTGVDHDSRGASSSAPVTSATIVATASPTNPARSARAGRE